MYRECQRQNWTAVRTLNDWILDVLNSEHRTGSLLVNKFTEDKAWSTGRFVSSQSLWDQLDRESRSHVATNITRVAATVLPTFASPRLVHYEELDRQLYRHCDTIPYLLMTELFKIGSSSTFLTNLFIYCLRKTHVGCRPYRKNEFGQHQRPTPPPHDNFESGLIEKIKQISRIWKWNTFQIQSWSESDHGRIGTWSGPDQDLISARSGLD